MFHVKHYDFDRSIDKIRSKSSKEKYQYIFTSLLDKLPDLVSKMREIEMISTENGVAECRISRLEDVGEVTYYIYFFHDEDGLWKIQQF